jgi:hypothetical protein
VFEGGERSLEFRICGVLMFRSSRILGWLLMTGAIVAPTASHAQGPAHKTVRIHQKGEKSDSLAPAVTPPPRPPQPPQVSYLNGQLTVISENATLGEILSAIQRQTGAVIDFPAGGTNEPVAGRMGPGAPCEVLANLLNGSRFDYVIIGSSGVPGGVEHVILIPRSNAGGGGAVSEVAQVQPVVPSPDQQPPDVAQSEGVEDRRCQWRKSLRRRRRRNPMSNRTSRYSSRSLASRNRTFHSSFRNRPALRSPASPETRGRTGSR